MSPCLPHEETEQNKKRYRRSKRMKKTIMLSVAMLSCGNVVAATDHYLRRDGGHVQHLKITSVDGEVHAAMDVDFEPTPDEASKGLKPCSVDLQGEVKKTGETELVLKKQIPEEARYCTIDIKLSSDSAVTKQSDDCRYFLANFCKFDSEGKALLKIK
jgi:hypothetical protein